MARRLSTDPIAEARRQWIGHGWSEAATGMTVVTSVIRAQQLLLVRVERVLRPHGLSFARFELLRLLAFTRRRRLPLASAIARLQVHPTSVTSTVERLAADGLLVKERHPDDGRAAMLVLTDAGAELIERATADLNGVFEDTGMAEDDELELVRILARFRRGADDFGDPAESTRAPRPRPGALIDP